MGILYAHMNMYIFMCIYIYIRISLCNKFQYHIILIDGQHPKKKTDSPSHHRSKPQPTNQPATSPNHLLTLKTMSRVSTRSQVITSATAQSELSYEAVNPLHPPSFLGETRPCNETAALLQAVKQNQLGMIQ